MGTSSQGVSLRSDQAPLTQTLKIENEPWHLYDFDFASLTVMTPHLERQADFNFDLAGLQTWRSHCP